MSDTEIITPSFHEDLVIFQVFVLKTSPDIDILYLKHTELLGYSVIPSVSSVNYDHQRDQQDFTISLITSQSLFNCLDASHDDRASSSFTTSHTYESGCLDWLVNINVYKRCASYQMLFC